MLLLRHPVSFYWNQPLLQEYLSKGELPFIYDALVDEKLCLICKPFFFVHLVPNIGRVKQLNNFLGIFCQRGAPVCLPLYLRRAIRRNRVRQTDVYRTDVLLFPVWFFLKHWATRVQFLGEAWHMLYATTPRLFRDKPVDNIRILYDKKKWTIV